MGGALFCNCNFFHTDSALLLQHAIADQCLYSISCVVVVVTVPVDTCYSFKTRKSSIDIMRISIELEQTEIVKCTFPLILTGVVLFCLSVIYSKNQSMLPFHLNFQTNTCNYICTQFFIFCKKTHILLFFCFLYLICSTFYIPIFFYGFPNPGMCSMALPSYLILPATQAAFYFQLHHYYNVLSNNFLYT